MYLIHRLPGTFERLDFAGKEGEKMDLSEVTGEVLNRHPWELSRTKYGR